MAVGHFESVHFQDRNLRPCRKQQLRLQLRLDQHIGLFFNTGRRADLAVAVAKSPFRTRPKEAAADKVGAGAPKPMPLFQ